jgi:tetratricopeptide (TPR) repeat protein
MSNRLPLTAPLLAAALLLALIHTGGCAREDRPFVNKNKAGDHAGGQQADSFEAAGKDPKVTAETSVAAAGWAEECGQLPKAAELYRQALKVDPKHKQALYRLGVVTAKLRQFPESIETWKKYVKTTGESAEAYSNLAYTYELAGQVNEAESAYEKGIAREPKNLPCRVNYGVLLAKQGKANEAKLQLQAVLSPAEVHYNLGSVYEQQGKRDQARAEYKKALELDSSLRDAQTRLSALPLN